MEGPPRLIGRRERRWLVIFLVIGSAYFAILLLRELLSVLSGFSQILLILFLAWLLAFVMSPLVRELSRRLPLPRAATVVLSYVALFVALGFLVFYSGAAITQQLAGLADDFPETERRIAATLRAWQESLHFGRLEIDLVELFEGARGQVEAIGGAIFEEAQAIAGVTVAAVGAFVLIVILSMYMVMDSRRILAKIGRIVPNRYETELQIFERSVARAFGGFLRAQIILALMQAALVAVIGVAFGMPFLFLIGTLSAIAMLIPFFGPPLALIPPIVGAAIYVTEWLWLIAALLIGIQTVVVNWLQPRLMQGALGLHPILVLVGLLVGAQVAGVWGALFGIPIIAVVNVFFNYLINLRTIAETEEVDSEAVVAQAQRDVPGAAPELVVALAAERAAEAHVAASREQRRAAGSVRSAAQQVEATAAEMREVTEELGEAAERIADEGKPA
jgi:predicted PurR-regulated permease PerM